MTTGSAGAAHGGNGRSDHGIPVETRDSVAIFGGGLAGPVLAAYLGMAGHAVEVYEKRPDPRTVPAKGGRSVNLAMSVRGMHALREVGALERILDLAIPMRGRMMHSVTGELTFQPYGTEEGQVLYSLSRDKLNELVVERADELPAVQFHFGWECAEYDPESLRATLVDASGTKARVVEHRAVVGADGAYSAVRWALQRRSGFDYSQSYLDYGYKELCIFPKAEGQFAIDPNALHIWPRSTYMLIALPNADFTHTCTLFWPLEGEASFSAIQSESEVRRFFESSFPDVPGLIPDYIEQFRSNPVGSLVTVRCHPYHAGRTVLIGDACHAVVPFYGQGMNAAFEDCTLLNEIVGESGDDWEEVFTRFSAERKDDADALADLALDNFVEMRDRVSSRWFLMRKARERWLHRLFPALYVPLYTMITFTQTPYAEAWRRARQQDRVVSWIGRILGLVILAVLVWAMYVAVT